MSFWRFVTDFGDSAVTTPLAALTLIFLLVRGETRIALAWAVAIGGCAAAIGALKLVFGACGAALSVPDIVSPSGHTAMSTAIYGALALLARAGWPRRSLAIGLAVAAAIAGIALSRVMLRDHSPAEIVFGFVVGAAAVGLFHALTRRRAAPRLPLGGLLLCGAVLVGAMHGTRWMVEPMVQRLAWDLRLAVPWCR